MSKVLKFKSKPARFRTTEADGKIVEEKDINKPLIDERMLKEAVEKAREEAAQIAEENASVREAKLKDQITRKTEEALERGRQEGYEKAMRELEEKYSEQLINKYDEFEKIIASIDDKLIEYEKAFEKILGSAAYAIAEKIIYAEIKREPAIDNVINAAAKKIMSANELTIRINPADYELLDSENKLPVFQNAFTRVKFEKNDRIERGGCFIESDIGNVDARIKTQLEEVKKLLEKNNLS